MPPPGGNQAAAALAAAVAPDPVAGAPPEAVRVAGSRELSRASRQEDRTGVWRSGVAARWYSDKGFGFIKPDDGGADVFIHKNALGGTRDLRLETCCAVRFVEVFDERKQKTHAQKDVVIKDPVVSSSPENSCSRSRSRKRSRPMYRQSALSRDFSDGGGSAAALQSAVLPSRAMEGAHSGPPTPILPAPVPSPTAESRSSNVEAMFSQTGQVPRGLELLTTSAGNEARVAPSLASGGIGRSAPMEVAEPTEVSLGIDSGDGYKNRVVLRNILVMAARVCLKRMVSSNKPGAFAQVTDLVNDMKVKFGFRVPTEITAKSCSSAPHFPLCILERYKFSVTTAPGRSLSLRYFVTLTVQILVHFLVLLHMGIIQLLCSTPLLP